MISIIMQSYLGDYPNSRSNPESKFIRAVESYLAQTHDDSELIIVSDGCEKTHQIYLERYSDEPSIRYAYIHHKGPRSYEDQGDSKRSFVGLPRQVGVDLARGEIITYLDTDDIILRHYVRALTAVWHKYGEDKMWAINNAWYDHESRLSLEQDADKELLDDMQGAPCIGLNGLEGKWFVNSVKGDNISMELMALSHRKECITKWYDTVGEFEDFNFISRLKSDHPCGLIYKKPSYVRFQYPGIWDM